MVIVSILENDMILGNLQLLHCGPFKEKLELFYELGFRDSMTHEGIM
jgi:hypothetical protein